jgi:hypothetical protein
MKKALKQIDDIINDYEKATDRKVGHIVCGINFFRELKEDLEIFTRNPQKIKYKNVWIELSDEYQKNTYMAGE